MRFIKSLIVLFSAFFFIQSAAVAEEVKGPNLWSISDDDTTVYIFGTIHLLNQEVEWITPQFQEAFATADGLILELSPEQSSQAVFQPLMVKYGDLPEGESISDYLTKENYSKLTEMLEDIEVPVNALDKLRPWLAEVSLYNHVAFSKGFMSEYWVEFILEESARNNGIPIYGLETAEVLISNLAGVSKESQNFLIELTLEELEFLEENFVQVRDLWLAGDMEGLRSYFHEDLEKAPNLAEGLIYQRNRNWIGEIQGIMEIPGIYLLAVGTRHLVGKQNLLELLEKAGYDVVLMEQPK